MAKKSPSKSKNKKISSKDFPTFKFVNERDIAMDFAQKVYEKFGKMIKSVILFGSTTKETRVSGSDIDVIIIVDDASVQFDQELIAWYREELGKIITSNPYKKELHINTVKLSTWWTDMQRGDPIILNVIRYGEAMLDFGGFFNPLKMLLQSGKIKPTPEAIYTALQRAPQHLARSKAAELNAIDGIYWALVDSSHALLMAAKLMPSSPEHIPDLLQEHFVSRKLLEEKYIRWYGEILSVHKGILHGNIGDVKGQDIDIWQERADLFIGKMSQLISEIIR